MNSGDLLKELKEGVTAKTSTTLDCIYEICMEQQDRGLHDFSIATIARLGYKRGVPRAQSIRNKSGERYRALIQSFVDSCPVKEKNSINKTAGGDWIEEIPSPKHRLLARMQAAELAAAQSKIRDFIPPGTKIDVYDHRSEGASPESNLTQQERRALEYIISKDFQRKWAFSETVYGEIVDSNEKVVLKAATIDAIKKALSNL